MSEFDSSYFDNSQFNDAYQTAINSANNARALSAEEFNKIKEKQEEEDKKYEPIKETLTTLGAIPLEEGVRDAVGKLARNAKLKVQKAIKDKVSGAIQDVQDKIVDKANQAKEQLTNKALDNVEGSNIKDVVSTGEQDLKNLRNFKISEPEAISSRATVGIPEAQLPENYIRLPKVNTQGVEEGIARRRALALLKAKNQRTLGKFDLSDNVIDDVNSLKSEDGVASLARARALTSTPRLEPVTLQGQSVEDISPQSFFQNTRGFQPQGELTKRSVDNPFSIMNDDDALQGARDFKEFNTLAQRKESMARSLASRTGAIDDAGIARAPQSTKALIPKAKLGDQLQPMRDALMNNNEYENAKQVAQSKADDIRTQLPDLEGIEEAKLPQLRDIVAEQEQMTLEGEDRKRREVGETEAEPQEVPNPVFDKKFEDSLGENAPEQTSAKTRAPDDLGIGENTGTDASDNINSGLDDAGQRASNVANVAEDVGEDAGESVGKALAKGASSALELDAELGGPEDLGGDLLSGIVGLSSIISGLFGHHSHHTAPPAPPPTINPAVALGI